MLVHERVYHLRMFLYNRKETFIMEPPSYIQQKKKIAAKITCVNGLRELCDNKPTSFVYYNMQIALVLADTLVMIFLTSM